MSEEGKPTRLNKAAAEFNVGISTLVEFLRKKGIVIEENPNTKISPEAYGLLVKEYAADRHVKEESMKIELSFVKHDTLTLDHKAEKPKAPVAESEKEDIIIKDISLGAKDKGVSAKPPAEEKPAAKKVAPPEVLPAPPEKEEFVPETAVEEKKLLAGLKIEGKIDLDQFKKPPKVKKEKDAKPALEGAEETEKKEPPKVTVDETPVKVETAVETLKEEKSTEEKKPEPDPNFLPTKVDKLKGLTITGKIELPGERKPVKKPEATSTEGKLGKGKRPRKRIKESIPLQSEPPKEKKDWGRERDHGKSRFKGPKIKPEVSEEEVQKQIRETLARLAPTGKSKASKYRKIKRETNVQQAEMERQRAEEDKMVLKVTEFVTVNEMANMMNVPVNEVISTFMQLGLFVSINQRLDAETLNLVADEFGYKVEFVSVEVQEAIEHIQEEDQSGDYADRPPIVTVMGHVDHGKTKLLDYIRNTNVVAGEAGGITQHIGAYEVQLTNGKRITFLDTPGHEAFTAMRARGAKVTDVAIIVVAADDDVMPQTVEAINHAQAANVPLVFAINKIDKPSANPEKIKEQLANMNILVEDWGGKYQSQEISAKQGLNVDQLLEKVLLEAEMLELKCNPERLAYGTVIESSLDKGRGYVAKVLVQNGTMNMGDMVLAGSHFGKVKAMYNERNLRITTAGPSAPVLLLGLDGAPQAGDKFNVMKDEREAKAIATKRQQLQREQGIRSQKHITLDEIGRRIAIGDFKELNLIVKGDVDGSVEALSDSLLKLSTREVQVNVIHKSVGQVTESDVLLASASNAIIVGFQVRPSVNARRLAEKEEIEIRYYSIIYQAIEEIKSAIEGMLSPEIEEKIICNIEVREVFKITKVGTVAGCHVLEGKITRQTRVRIIRDGIVVYTGKLGSLKRFKDDVKEVTSGMECGLNIDNYNDIRVGDIIEGFEEIEVKRKL
jgi:translation initiation factor IF-2